MTRPILVILSLLAIASCECATIKETTRDVKEAIIDCTKPAAVTVAPELVSYVEEKVTEAIESVSSPTVDWEKILRLAKTFSIDVGGCLIAKVVAKYTKPSTEVPRGLLTKPIPDAATLKLGFRDVAARAYSGARFKLEDQEM